MDEYVARQRNRWNGIPASSTPPSQPRTVTPPPDPAAASQLPTDLVRIHIMPVVSAEVRASESFSELSEEDRLESVIPFLKRLADSHAVVSAGVTFSDARYQRFCVVKTEPEFGGYVTPETDFFVNGPSAVLLKKVQFVALLERSWEEPESAEIVSDRLFTTWLSPMIQARVKEDHSQMLPVFINQALTGDDDSTRFVITAMDPMPPGDALGIVDTDTMAFIDVDMSGDFSRIHVLPFQDTLPRVYDFEVFEDYLKPFFLMNPMALYSVNTQFAFHGVQFKVVCVDPSDGRPRRIGPSTVIHCEGLLHATLRNMLPAELLEQLSTLPPGLQMLLINTELLASADVLDRFIDLQETLAARRGIAPELLQSLPVESYHKPETEVERPESASQCMICLSDFEEGEALRRLPCTHVFHQPCIDEWLLHRSTQCCLCKVEVDRALARQQ